MRRTSSFLTVVAGVLAALIGFGAPALASGLHWDQGKTPTITVTGDNTSSATVSASGQVAGAGGYIHAWLTVQYDFASVCYNSGQDSGPVPGKSGSASFTSPEQVVPAVHGNASFNLGPYTISQQSSGCPNGGWTAVTTVDITSVTVNVTSSNGGSLQYTETF